MDTVIKIAKMMATGVYHDTIEAPCQDAVNSFKDGGYASIVLCDGCGSIPGSENAAKLVTNFLPKYLCDNFREFEILKDDLLKKIILAEISNQAKTENINLDCTLLALVTNGEKELIFHIGDGIIIGSEKNEYEVISYPENGNNNNETFFLSGEMALNHLRVYRNNKEAYFLTSDGISDLIYSNNNVLPAVSIMLNWLKDNDEKKVEEKCLFEIERLFKQRTNDDISVGMIYKNCD